MTVLEPLFPAPLLHVMGWTLMHSLWQGALVALTLVSVLQLLRGQAPNLRYSASCSALALMLLLPFVTFWRLNASSLSPDVDEMTIQSPSGNAIQNRSGEKAGLGIRSFDTPPVSQDSLPRRFLTEQLDSLMPWLSAFWLLGVLGLSARAVGGMLYTKRLISCNTHSLGSYSCERLKDVAKRLRLTKSVQLLESTLVQVPTTIGWFRPLILLPCSALAGLTPQQLDLILAHELAHIRRHDYLINLLQVLVETLLFYHPAVWWISKQVRNERELVCDDMAVSVCGDPIAYARALTKTERLRKETPLLGVAADGGTLGQRILRLIDVLGSLTQSWRRRSVCAGFHGVLR